MKRIAWIGFVVLSGLLSCSTGNGPCDGTNCGADVRPGDATGDGAMDAPADAANAFVSLEITPAMATLVSTDGSMPTQLFRATGVRGDGSRVGVAAVFTLDTPRIGAMASDGTFTANGVAAGHVLIRAEATVAAGAVLHASADLTVRVERRLAAAGTDLPAAMAHFAGANVADPAREAHLLYPLDGALMPNNVGAPDVQWERGAAGDVYRVRLEKTTASVAAFVTHTGTGFRYDWPVDRGAWRTLSESDRAEPITLTVDRWESSSSQVVRGTPLHVQLTRGAIYGAVYYWDLENGRMERIHADTQARENLFPSPPASSTGDRCVACHTISRDGRYLAASLWLAPGATQLTLGVFDLTTDLTGNPTPTVFPLGAARMEFGTFDPAATRVMAAGIDGLLRIYDAHTGVAMAATELPTRRTIYPEWSPDGSLVALVAPLDGTNAAIFTSSDLVTMPATTLDSFGALTTLHHGGDLTSSREGGAADSHPTWSPDSRVLAFMHGVHSQSDSNIHGNIAPAGLYVVPRAGGAPTRLDRAAGGADQTTSYWPTFSPFVTPEPGESHTYYWLGFFSFRDYGNAQAGTRGTHRRQLWVTAIDANAPPGTDPSSVPYWIPGQDTATENLAAYWAPLACRTTGSDCSTSSECCSENCGPEPGMPTHFVCLPPTGACRGAGQTCGAASECCTGLECFANVCVAPPG